MRQAIETKYLGPTNYRGGRIRASAQAGSVTVPYDHALGVDENHTHAARVLLRKKGWTGHLIGGGNARGTGNCYVVLPSGKHRRRKLRHAREEEHEIERPSKRG